MLDVRNIYCVGRNYKLHALELGNEVPTSPMIFTKPTHALCAMNGASLIIPQDRGEVHFELELVVKISDHYVSGIEPDQAIDAFTLGLDLTLRDVQSELKRKGHPWLAAKGFKGAATIGRWLPFSNIAELVEGEFMLMRNGEQAQIGHPKQMIFDIPTLIQFIDTHYGLGAGDIIYTGTPAGVAALHSGDKLSATWNGEQLAYCDVE